jgi:RNA recognition motif-containing protein
MSYHHRKPRGFGFVEFLDPRDSEDALYALDRTVVMGREIQVCAR